MSEKKKSKKQIEKELEASKRRQLAIEGALRAKEKKSKKKGVPKGDIRACNCVATTGPRMKTPGIAAGFAGFYPVPMNLRSLGAEFQDRRYGRGMRLHNNQFAKEKFVGVRCTICGNTVRL